MKDPIYIIMDSYIYEYRKDTLTNQLTLEEYTKLIEEGIKKRLLNKITEMQCEGTMMMAQTDVLKAQKNGEMMMLEKIRKVVKSQI